MRRENKIAFIVMWSTDIFLALVGVAIHSPLLLTMSLMLVIALGVASIALVFERFS